MIARAIHAAAEWLTAEHAFGLVVLVACVILFVAEIEHQWPRDG